MQRVNIFTGTRKIASWKIALQKIAPNPNPSPSPNPNPGRSCWGAVFRGAILRGAIFRSPFLTHKNFNSNLHKNQKQALEVFYKKSVLETFKKFTGKHLCQSLFFNRVAALRRVTLLKKRLWRWCFTVNFAKF